MRFASLSLLLVLAGCGGDPETQTVTAEERAALPGLVYESDASGTRGAYRLDLATGESIRLSDPDQNEVPLAVSPDGAGLVLGRAVGEGEHALEQLVLVDGDSLRALTPPTRRARNPSWSDDGRWITFESDLASTSDLFRVARDGSATERLTDNPEGNYEPHAAPGGAILFVSSRDMNAETYRMQADGSGQTRLPGSPRDEWAPRLSPDGQRLVLLTRERGIDELILARPDGLDRQRLGATREMADAEEVLETSPAWHPDGRRIAYVTLSRSGDRTVWAVDVETREHQRLAEGWDPAWSPDGSALAFVSDRHGTPDLFLLRADGTGLTRLTSSPGADTRPLWLPL